MLLMRPHPFWHPIRRRRFDGALVVLLARYWFQRFDAITQERVDNELTDLFWAQNLDPYGIWLQMVGRESDSVAILRGIAMARLNMPTGVEGLEWNEFVRPAWLRGPMSALYAFRKFDAANDDAADFLRAHGLSLDETAVQGLRWMTDMHARYP